MNECRVLLQRRPTEIAIQWQVASALLTYECHCPDADRRPLKVQFTPKWAFGDSPSQSLQYQYRYGRSDLTHPTTRRRRPRPGDPGRSQNRPASAPECPPPGRSQHGHPVALGALPTPHSAAVSCLQRELAGLKPVSRRPRSSFIENL